MIFELNLEVFECNGLFWFILIEDNVFWEVVFELEVDLDLYMIINDLFIVFLEWVVLWGWGEEVLWGCGGMFWVWGLCRGRIIKELFICVELRILLVLWMEEFCIVVGYNNYISFFLK